VLAAGGAAASTAAPSGTVSVFFVRGEQLASVKSTGSTSADAVRPLLAGNAHVARAV